MFVPEMWPSHTATCALKLLLELKEYTDLWGKTNTTIIYSPPFQCDKDLIVYPLKL